MRLILDLSFLLFSCWFSVKAGLYISFVHTYHRYLCDFPSRCDRSSVCRVLAFLCILNSFHIAWDKFKCSFAFPCSLFLPLVGKIVLEASRTSCCSCLVLSGRTPIGVLWKFLGISHFLLAIRPLEGFNIKGFGGLCPNSSPCPLCLEGRRISLIRPGGLFSSCFSVIPLEINAFESTTPFLL